MPSEEKFEALSEFARRVLIVANHEWGALQGKIDGALAQMEPAQREGLREYLTGSKDLLHRIIKQAIDNHTVVSEEAHRLANQERLTNQE